MRWVRFRPRFSLRSLLLLVLLIGSTAMLWRNWEPWQCIRVIEAKPGVRYAAEYSQNGSKLLVSDREERNRIKSTIYDGASGRPLATIPHSDNRQEASFTKNEKWVLLHDPSPFEPTYTDASLFDAQTGREIREFSRALNLSFSADEERILVTYSDLPAEIRDGKTLEVLARLEKHDLLPDTVGRLSPDGKIAVIGNDVFDCTNGKRISSLKEIRSEQRVAISPDHRWIVYQQGTNRPRSISICDFETGAVVATMGGDLPRGNCFTPDGSGLLVHGFWETRVFKLGKAPLTVEHGFSGCVPELGAFSADGKTLVTFLDETLRDAGKYNYEVFNGPGPQCNVLIWEFQSEKQVGAFRSSYYTFNTQCRWVGDFMKFESVLWNTRTHTHRATSFLYVETTGNLIAGQTAGEGVVLADVASEQVFQTLPVDDVTLSPSGKHLFATTDQTLQFWEKRRDEHLSGALILPELWLTLVLSISFLWSVRRDWREYRKTAA